MERAALDAALAELRAGEVAWGRRTAKARAALLLRVHAAVAATAADWAATAARAKGLPADSPLVGEEWMAGPYAVLTALSALSSTLSKIAAGRSPLDGVEFGSAAGGRRVTVPALPSDALQGVLLHGFRADVWLRPGVTADEASASAGLASRHPARTGGIGLVLGAGNVTSIAPLDVLSELVAHNRVVLLKLNPTLAALEDVYRAALAPLVEVGALRIVLGGAETGAFLVSHPAIAHVHITGSAVTHDRIVFGDGDDGRRRRAAGTPLLRTPITSELGGVSPVIVVPGRWSAADIEFQAAHVATMRLHNGGYNCIAGQLVVVSADWSQKDAFIAALRRALDRAPERRPWYPGSADRVDAAATAYPDAARLGRDGGRLLVRVARHDAAEIASTEYFAPVLGVLEIAGRGRRFLDAAVDYANDELVGTLGANIVIDPTTRSALGDGFERAIAALRYGTVAVNTWTALGFLTPTATWGAFPGHTLDDVQSGIGVVHNALLLDRVERTVVRGPFRPFPRSVAGGELSLFPTPPWFVTSRSAATTGRRLTELAADPTWRMLPRVFAAAFRA